MESQLSREVARQPLTISPVLIRPSELNVVRLIVEGLANKEIADRLGISEKTVEKHRHNVLVKLKCHSMAHAIHTLHMAKILP